MTPSKDCTDLIKGFEGYRSKSYQDDAGVWTIGWGHTLTARPNMSVTAKEARALLGQDILTAANAVSDLVDVSLTQSQFDALTSFVFNLGSGAFSRSTLLKVINANDFDAVGAQFMRWVWVTRPDGTKEVLSGLVKRRSAEYDLFSGDSEPQSGGQITAGRVRVERESLKQSRTVKAGGGAVIGAVTAGGTTALGKVESLTESVSWFDDALAGLFVFGIILAIGAGIYAIYCRRDDWIKAGR